MRFEQLRILCDIVDHGFSISRAAEDGAASQSAISKQLTKLEDELGFELIKRRRGRVFGLTDEGQSVLQIARRILQEERRIHSIGKAADRHFSERIGVVTSHTTATYVLPRVISRFAERYPNVRIDLISLVPNTTYEAIRSGQADIGITSEAPPQNRRGLLALRGYDMKRSLLMPHGHSLGQPKSLTLAAIAEHPLVVHSFSVLGAMAVAKKFHSSRLKPKFSMTTFDTDAIKNCVRLGLGVGIVPSACFDSAVDRGLEARDVTRLFGLTTMFIVAQATAHLRMDIAYLIECLMPRLNFDQLKALAGENR